MIVYFDSIDDILLLSRGMCDQFAIYVRYHAKCWW